MKRIYFLLAFIAVFQNIIISQSQSGPGRYLPKLTPKGMGKIDTRIDNMSYWRRMADSGFVYVAPVESVTPAIYTGSGIESLMVMSANSPDIPTTTVNSTQSENSVFVNPVNNQAVLNSNNSTQNPVGSLYGADYLLSVDGGATWGGSVNSAGGSNSGDPTTAISLGGRQYIGFINSASGQSVSYSTNGGTSWTPVVSGICPTGANNLLDKNHMWIDNSPTSSYNGNLYNSWTCFGGTNDAEIEISRSTNGGLNWSAQTAISTAVNAGSHCQGVNIQTGPNGIVYVIWAIYDSWPSDETSIGFAKSANGGSSFASATRIISNIRGIRSTATSKNHRVNSFPSMAVDISGGPNNGNIYVVWANHGVPGINTGSGIDVYMIRSTNGGTGWSAPVRINQDPAGLGKQHYFPWITCDPSNGNLSVIFYDDRNVSSSMCEVFVASSFDAGNTWEDFKVSDVAFTPAPIPGLASSYMGDYLGVSAVNTRVYPTWTDNRSGTTLTYVSPFILTLLPTVDFGANSTIPCLNQTVQFQDMSLKNPTSWYWTITPAGYSYVNSSGPTSQNPQVQFNAYGNYSVKLKAANSYGSDSLTKTNYISVNNANADFSANITTVMINNNVIFTDQSSCNISSYSWNFGTGAVPATANTQGPHTVSYSTEGFKTVSLTVNGNVTKTKSNYIQVLPESFNMANGTITTCSGVFYDPQGTSNYLDNLDYTMTLMPTDASKRIQAVFSLFALEANSRCDWDWLKIYDGTTTSATLLGTWCGSNSPGTVAASNSDGALTFKFHSDVSVTAEGWVANISCFNAPPPSYCAANATTCDEYIARFQINTINNVTACTSGGYANYTALSTKVSPGFTYPATITNGNLNWPTDMCGIWIDWNQDFDFTDVGETITVSGNPGVGPYTANIIPPVNALKGLARMRTRIIYSGTLSSCGTSSYGEVEDYSIYVGTPGLWTGGTAGSETSWNTANNWDDGRVPTASTNVTIPQGSTYYPVVSGLFSCDDLQIKNGATVTVQPGATMNINGNLDVGQGVSGTLVVNGGTCNVSGVITALQGSVIDIINGGIMNDNP